ncbi:hypothetical protein HDU76_010047 [Blyttiomyces sp. JEL0837]|nr:hypothetical protein HDU76_010047 [Blyttiomyces sp. JEL0837]
MAPNTTTTTTNTMSANTGKTIDSITSSSSIPTTTTTTTPEILKIGLNSHPLTQDCITKLTQFLNRINFYNTTKIPIPPNTDTTYSTTTLPPPNLETLFRIQYCLQVSIPYENMSVYFRPDFAKGEDQVPIRLDFDSVFHKIVERKRGGFCMELNLLYGWALRLLGYTVEFRTAQSMLGIPTDDLTQFPRSVKTDSHLINLVSLPQSHIYIPTPPPTPTDSNHETLMTNFLSASKWLCDVGCSSKGCLTPLPLIDGSQAIIAGGHIGYLYNDVPWSHKKGWMYYFKEDDVGITYERDVMDYSPISRARFSVVDSGVPPRPDDVTKYMVEMYDQVLKRNLDDANGGNEKPLYKYERFFLFEEFKEPTEEDVRIVLEFVCRKENTAPPPGFCGLACMANVDGSRMTFLGNMEIGFKFIVKDLKGVEIERVVLEGLQQEEVGDGNGDERETVAFEKFKALARERYGLEGFEGDI